jgi:hypothetical protein
MIYCPHGTKFADYLYEVEREYPPGTLNEEATALPLRVGRSTIASGTAFRTNVGKGLFADCEIHEGTLFWDVNVAEWAMANDPTVDMRPVVDARTAVELRSALHDLMDTTNRRTDSRINVVSAIEQQQDSRAPTCYLALRDIHRGEEILRRYGPLVWLYEANMWVTPANVAGYLAFAEDVSEMGGCCFGYLGIPRTFLLKVTHEVLNWLALDHPWVKQVAGPGDIHVPALWDEAIGGSNVDPELLYSMRWEVLP